MVQKHGKDRDGAQAIDVAAPVDARLRKRGGFDALIDDGVPAHAQLKLKHRRPFVASDDSPAGIPLCAKSAVRMVRGSHSRKSTHTCQRGLAGKWQRSGGVSSSGRSRTRQRGRFRGSVVDQRGQTSIGMALFKVALGRSH